MTTLGAVLRDKGVAVVSVRPERSVFEALAIMAQKNIGAVLVIDSHGDLVGILSERDYARKVALRGQTARETKVSAIMSDKVITAGPETRIEEALELMTDAHVRHLPVLDRGQLAGIVSIGDVVKAIISNKDFAIGQLERYIAGA